MPNPEPLTPATIRALRHHLGMTQPQLAAMIGCSQAALSLWESGRRTPTGLYATAVRRVMAIAPTVTKPAAVR